tara:strand:- start:5671 stop:7023 length:1353 start_codon:yes stop_codon:yes gene_type:complete
MNIPDLAIIILAAGKGTRMKSSKHKVLHNLGGKSMLQHLMDKTALLKPLTKIIVVGAQRDQVALAVNGQADIIMQEPQLGTGHAVNITKEKLCDFKGNVLILFGDVPLLSQVTMQKMIDNLNQTDADIVVLGFTPEDAKGYGRLKLNNKKVLEAIIEDKDASNKDRSISLCNSGAMCIDGTIIFDLLSGLDNNNSVGEYYLTDIIKVANLRGLKCAVVEAKAEEVIGVNSRSDLAKAEAFFQEERRQHFMDEGVSLTDPASVFFSYDTKIGKDVNIGPNVTFGIGVQISDDVTINPYCHIEGAIIGSGSSIGPFARLRPAVELGERVKVGNFVEIKKTKIGNDTKISHLSYIGDAKIGKNSNIGAGTITCNYDGYLKYQTVIGEGAFIGSNSALVAPVNIGAGAIVGAGSVITSIVEKNSLALSRVKQRELGGWATKFRQRKQHEIKIKE